MPGSLTWEDLDGKLVGQGCWDGLCVCDWGHDGVLILS